MLDTNVDPLEVTPKKRTKKAVQEAAVAKVVQTLNIKDFLALPKNQRPSTLMTKTLTLGLSEEVDLAVEVKQLTSTEVGLFNRRILNNMPAAPLVEHIATQASKDPETGRIRPAGTYREQNPSDPGFVREMEIWFNNAAIWLALFSAHESMGLELEGEDFETRFEVVQDEFPPAALMAVALGASEVNPGLHIADEIQKQYYQGLAQTRMTEEYKRIAGNDSE